MVIAEIFVFIMWATILVLFFIFGLIYGFTLARRISIRIEKEDRPR